MYYLILFIIKVNNEETGSNGLVMEFEETITIEKVYFEIWMATRIRPHFVNMYLQLL